MPQHSPEPWKIREGSGWCTADESIDDAKGKPVVEAKCAECRGDEPVCNAANARRIVGCVNALAGVPDGLLEAAGEVIREMLARPLPVSTLTADERGE